MRPSCHGVQHPSTSRSPVYPLIATAVLIAVCLIARPVDADVVESLGGATISRDEGARTWTLETAGARLILSVDASVDYQLVTLQGPTGRRWMPAAGADTWTVINAKHAPFGSRAAGYEFERASTEHSGRSLRLAVSYRFTPANVRVTRHVAIVDRSPTFEMWTTFESLGADVVLSDLNAFDLTVRDGAVRWLNGLQGSTSDTPQPSAFALNGRRIPMGEEMTVGAAGRSSESTVPWFAIDGESEEFYAGLLWSGAWRLHIQHVADGLMLSFGLPHMSTTIVRGTVEGPHVILGAVDGGLSEAAAALRHYVVDGLRGGRGFAPLVTFNTWFADGTRISDPSVRDSMARAAAIGTELFVLDAGWYAGAGAEDLFDFHSGLGRWQPDAARFPEGLNALSTHAHDLGMKFGIWVEPERIDLDVASEVAVDLPWLATSHGRHVTDRTGQVCLAGAAGRQWVWQRLTTFIDQVRPDYLKWDNNAWLNCDREGHGHGATDGNFAHVNGLYDILARLRERYPDLIVENVSGGGNRLDFGMLRYSDVGWMDDRSGPSRYVRHHAEGLGAVFPPAYLLAFVTTQDASEGLTSFQDLSLYFRSRMMGVLGMSFPLRGLVTGDAIVRETGTYKRLRAALQDGSGGLLSGQAQMEDGPPWDVFQVTSADGGQVLLYAFQNGSDAGMMTLPPAGLQTDAIYRVESVDVGELGEASGSDLMSDGIEVFPSERTAAHILIVRRISP